MDASNGTQRKSLKLIVKGGNKARRHELVHTINPVTANREELVFCAKALPAVH